MSASHFRDEGALVRTCIRHAKRQAGIDLSRCSRWLRFIEVQYQRPSAASNAAGQEVLVTAEGEQHEGGVGMGGETYRDGPATVATQPNECAVYFVCDVDACVPSEAEWPAVYAEDKAWRKAKAEGVALDLATVAEAAAKAQTEKHGVDKGKKQAVRSTQVATRRTCVGNVWASCAVWPGWSRSK